MIRLPCNCEVSPDDFSRWLGTFNREAAMKARAQNKRDPWGGSRFTVAHAPDGAELLVFGPGLDSLPQGENAVSDRSEGSNPVQQILGKE